MLPIGDQWNAIDTPPYPDFILRKDLITCHPNQGRGHTQVDLRGDRATGQLLYRLDCSSDRAGDNHQHNEDTGQVLRTIVTIGVAMVGCAVGEDKGYLEGNRCQYIAQVMEGIGEKSCTTADARDGKLNCCYEKHPCC